jgi:uncharacterized delta-60 repeat protein
MQQKWNDSLQHLFRPKNALLAALALALAPTLIYGQTQSGTLDASFGVAGKVTTDFAGFGDGANALAVQADGKLVAVGGATVFRNGVLDGDFALARYNSNGTLDTSFGTGGRVTTDLGGRSEGAGSVALQGNGKIVVGGTSVIGLFADFAVARYNSNGTLDTSFGTGGKVITEFANDTNRVALGQVSATAYSVAVQPDGKIVLAGEANIDGEFEFAVVRYNANGTLDAGFGAGGRVITEFGRLQQGFSNALAYSVAVQGDGKIVVAGEAYIVTGRDFALARYNSNGTLDTSFGTGGKLTTDFGGPDEFANSLVVQLDGKVVVAGMSSVSRGDGFALVRYNSNGTLDLSFGTGGLVSTDFFLLDQGFSSAYADSLALEADGGFVAAGRAYFNGGFHSGLARYDNNGTLDASFGTGGKVTADFQGPNGSDQFADVVVQPDGKIVAAVAGLSDFTLVRYNVGLDQPAPAPAGATTSPDGTTVPSAGQIVDNAGAVWTIGANQAILRNGAQAAGGAGSQILWKSSTIYVLGTDNNWYQWTGSGWVNVGPVQPGATGTSPGTTGTSPGTTGASPDGTTVPSAGQIVDNAGAVWTIGANQAILRSGAQAAGGAGSQILWKSGTIYVLGTDNNWYQWTGAGWANVGRTRP